MGISARLLSDINENDAKASLRMWSQTLAEQSGTPVDSNVQIMASTDALINAFREKEMESAGVTAEEFLTIEHEVQTSNLVAEGGTNAGEIYLLLVNQKSGIKTLADLKGRDLLISDSTRMSLAGTWLDVLLARNGFPRPEQFFNNVSRKKKLANVVLPVFFGTASACLVSGRGFDAMAELNPQVGKQLRAIATSERFVAGLVCFRAGAPNQEKIIRGLLRFPETPRGQQVLTLFQADAVAPLPRQALESAIQLLADHKRLCPSPDTANAAAGTSTGSANSP